MRTIANSRTLTGGRSDEILVGGNWALQGYGPKKASKKVSKKTSKKLSRKGGCDAFELNGAGSKKASKKMSKKASKKKSTKRRRGAGNSRVLIGGKKKSTKKKSTKKKSMKKRIGGAKKKSTKKMSRKVSKKKSTKKKSVKRSLLGKGSSSHLIGGKKKSTKKMSKKLSKKFSKKASKKGSKKYSKKGGNFWDWISNAAEDVVNTVEKIPLVKPLANLAIKAAIGGATPAQMKRAQADFTKAKRRADIKLRDVIDYERMGLIEDNNINPKDKETMRNLTKHIADRKRMYSDDLKLQLLQSQAEVYDNFANHYFQ